MSPFTDEDWALEQDAAGRHLTRDEAVAQRVVDTLSGRAVHGHEFAPQVAETRPADLPSEVGASPESATRDTTGTAQPSEAGGEATAPGPTTIGVAPTPPAPQGPVPSSPLDPFIVVRRRVQKSMWFMITELDGPDHKPTVIAETSLASQAYRICHDLNELARQRGTKAFIRPDWKLGGDVEVREVVRDEIEKHDEQLVRQLRGESE